MDFAAATRHAKEGSVAGFLPTTHIICKHSSHTCSCNEWEDLRWGHSRSVPWPTPVGQPSWCGEFKGVSNVPIYVHLGCGSLVLPSCLSNNESALMTLKTSSLVWSDNLIAAGLCIVTGAGNLVCTQSTSWHKKPWIRATDRLHVLNPIHPGWGLELGQDLRDPFSSMSSHNSVAHPPEENRRTKTQWIIWYLPQNYAAAQGSETVYI